MLSLKEKQQHTIALPTYKLPARTYMFYDRPVKYRIIFVDFGIWLKATWSSSIVYILNKGKIYCVYEVHMKTQFYILSESPPFSLLRLEPPIPIFYY